MTLRWATNRKIKLAGTAPLECGEVGRWKKGDKMPKKEEDMTEDERIIEWHKRRYESLRERFNWYRKALYIMCDNDKEKVKLTLEKVEF